MGKGRYTAFPSPPPPLYTHFLPKKIPLKGHSYSAKFKVHKDTAALWEKRLAARKQANLSRHVK